VRRNRRQILTPPPPHSAQAAEAQKQANVVGAAAKQKFDDLTNAKAASMKAAADAKTKAQVRSRWEGREREGGGGGGVAFGKRWLKLCAVYPGIINAILLAPSHLTVLQFFACRRRLVFFCALAPHSLV
jgi:hypothetical protein